MTRAAARIARHGDFGQVSRRLCAGEAVDAVGDDPDDRPRSVVACEADLIGLRVGVAFRCRGTHPRAPALEWPDRRDKRQRRDRRRIAGRHPSRDDLPSAVDVKDAEARTAELGQALGCHGAEAHVHGNGALDRARGEGEVEIDLALGSRARRLLASERMYLALGRGTGETVDRPDPVQDRPAATPRGLRPARQ